MHPVIILQELRSGTLLFVLQALRSGTLLSFFQELRFGTLLYFQMLRSGTSHYFSSGFVFPHPAIFLSSVAIQHPVGFSSVAVWHTLLSLFRGCPRHPGVFPSGIVIWHPIISLECWNLAHPTIPLQSLRYGTLLPTSWHSRPMPALIRHSCVMFGNMTSFSCPRNILSSGWPLTGILVKGHHNGINEKPFLHDEWTLHLGRTTPVS